MDPHGQANECGSGQNLLGPETLSVSRTLLFVQTTMAKTDQCQVFWLVWEDIWFSPESPEWTAFKGPQETLRFGKVPWILLIAD